MKLPSPQDNMSWFPAASKTKETKYFKVNKNSKQLGKIQKSPRWRKTNICRTGKEKKAAVKLTTNKSK